MRSWRKAFILATAAIGVSFACAAGNASGETSTGTPPARPRKIRAIDADNRNIWLNRTGMITVIIGTNEDSQDAAREAGKAMYPFQGRRDFQLIVVVDLRDSIANWVPSMVTGRMRVSLDQEAVELKPWFLKNGNKSNPRWSSHVVPDFSGTICPQLGWKDSSGSLRAILFGVDGRELMRLDKVDDMSVLQEDVRKAIQAQVDIEQARMAETAKTLGSKLFHPANQHPPIIPYTPYPKKN